MMVLISKSSHIRHRHRRRLPYVGSTGGSTRKVGDAAARSVLVQAEQQRTHEKVAAQLDAIPYFMLTTSRWLDAHCTSTLLMGKKRDACHATAGEGGETDKHLVRGGLRGLGGRLQEVRSALAPPRGGRQQRLRRRQPLQLEPKLHAV